MIGQKELNKIKYKALKEELMEELIKFKKSGKMDNKYVGYLLDEIQHLEIKGHL